MQETLKGNMAILFATALSDNDIYNLYTSKSIKFSSSSTSKLILDKTKTGTMKSKNNKINLPKASAFPILYQTAGAQFNNATYKTNEVA